MGTKQNTLQGERILRRPEVEIRTGLSRSAIYAGIQRGSFPKPRRLGANSVGWLEQEINLWIQARTEA